MTRRRCRIASHFIFFGRALVVVPLWHAPPAWTQVSGTVAVVSDYRYRGESLSDEKPAVQATVAYDHPSGFYGGVLASSLEFAGDDRRSLQTVAFGGYTQRLGSGRRFDIGVDYAAFSHNADYDYAELYAGLTFDPFNARIYYAADYFGQGANTAYAEINVAKRAFDRLDLLGHVGVLRPFGANTSADRWQFDIRLGAGVDFHGFALRAEWVGTNTSHTVYPIADPKHRETIVLTIARSF